MNKITTTLFAQLINLLPRDILASIASEYARPGNATKYSVWDQLVALVFCHIAGCDSLREIEDGMYSALGTLNHALGAQPLKRSTLAYANGKRDYHIFERYYFALLEHFKKLFEFELPNSYAKPTFAIDSTTITLCMKLFPWAQYTSTKGGIKLHTALDLSTGLPVVMNMTSAKVHDSKATREIINRLPKFSVVVMDRGYNDYELFEELSLRGTKFVTRLKENAQTSTLAKVAEDEENGDWASIGSASPLRPRASGAEIVNYIWFSGMTSNTIVGSISSPTTWTSRPKRSPLFTETDGRSSSFSRSSSRTSM